MFTEESHKSFLNLIKKVLTISTSIALSYKLRKLENVVSPYDDILYKSIMSWYLQRKFEEENEEFEIIQ